MKNNTNKSKNTGIVAMIRQIKDAMHDEWVKDPEASARSLMGSVEHYNRKYGSQYR